MSLWMSKLAQRCVKAPTQLMHWFVYITVHRPALPFLYICQSHRHDTAVICDALNPLAGGHDGQAAAQQPAKQVAAHARRMDAAVLSAAHPILLQRAASIADRGHGWLAARLTAWHV